MARVARHSISGAHIELKWFSRVLLSCGFHGQRMDDHITEQYIAGLTGYSRVLPLQGALTGDSDKGAHTVWFVWYGTVHCSQGTLRYSRRAHAGPRGLCIGRLVAVV